MSHKSAIQNPVEFFVAHGFLHDSEIIDICCRILNGIVEVSVDDLNAAFLDLPNDPGRWPGKLIFEGAKTLNSNLYFVDGVVISKSLCFVNNGYFLMEFELRYGGFFGEGRHRASIDFTFDKLFVTATL